MSALQRTVIYPAAAREAGAQGTVWVQLVVDPEGAPYEVNAVRSPHPALAAAAVRAVSAARFQPGLLRGDAVHARHTLPIRFVLREIEPAPEPPPAEDPVEVDPVLHGGLEGLQARVEYPESARRLGLVGTIYTQFVVLEDGSVSEARVVRDDLAVASDNPKPRDVRRARADLREASVAAVRTATFTPGTQGGVPVKIRYTLPIRFVLR